MGFITKGDIELDINGEKFEIDSTDIDLIERLDIYAKEAPVLMEKLKDREDVIQASREAMQYGVDSVDKFLGEGASAKIWKDQKVTIFKVASVIQHINDKILESRETTLSKFSPNRAVRRKK